MFLNKRLMSPEFLYYKSLERGQNWILKRSGIYIISRKDLKENVCTIKSSMKLVMTMFIF